MVAQALLRSFRCAPQSPQGRRLGAHQPQRPQAQLSGARCPRPRTGASRRSLEPGSPRHSFGQVPQEISTYGYFLSRFYILLSLPTERSPAENSRLSASGAAPGPRLLWAQRWRLRPLCHPGSVSQVCFQYDQSPPLISLGDAFPISPPNAALPFHLIRKVTCIQTRQERRKKVT